MTPPSTPLRPADNPFASHRIDRLRFRPQGKAWPELLERVADLGWRAAIVGAEGAGKSALLGELATHAPAPATLVVLDRDTRHPIAAVRARLPRPASRDRVLLLDGAELLRPLEWWWLRHAAGHLRGLVVTAHRPGRLPTLITCRTSPALLKELVAELAPERLAWLEPLLEDLFERHGGNVRECLLELYDVCAGRE